MAESLPERIKKYQRYLFEIGAFLSEIKFRCAEFDQSQQISQAVEDYLDGFNHRPTSVLVDLQPNIEVPKDGVVYFTDKEIQTMPKIFRRLMIIDKKRCRLRTHKSGINSTSYEIRYRRDGYDISASGKTLELAKQNFLKKLQTAVPKPKTKDLESYVPTTFTQFALFYFENYRKIKIKPLTYSIDLARFERHIKPFFLEKPIKAITPRDCQVLLNKFLQKGQGKTADEVHSLMNVTFKCAIAHGLISRNPLDIIPHVQHERQSGTALTKQEELQLFSAPASDVIRLSFALMLYCGLRPNEVSTAYIDGPFIIAVNSKRKTKKVQYKRIPIIARLRPFLPADLNFNVRCHEKVRKEFKKILPNHKTYDLRTTFYTRCDEFGVETPARDEFVGHSSGVLTNTYRDLSDEYLLKEGNKLNEW